jgi:hypothetical protein
VLIVLREKYCWLVAGGWFVLREKYEDHVWFEDRWMVASWCDE